jgi:hypothetical protein
LPQGFCGKIQQRKQLPAKDRVGQASIRQPLVKEDSFQRRQSAKKTVLKEDSSKKNSPQRKQSAKKTVCRKNCAMPQGTRQPNLPLT